MQDDFSNELKGLKTDWESLSDELSYRLVDSVRPSYFKRTQDLLNRWFRETGLSHEGEHTTLIAFAKWLRDVQRHRLSPSAWRSYKYQCMQTLPYQDFLSIVSVPPSTSKKDVVRSTSSRRRRHFKPAAVRSLEFHFSRSKSPYAQDVIELVHATLVTGLRPSEWIDVSLDLHEGYLPYLKVKNVKKGTQALSVPKKYRAVPLSHLDDAQMQCINNTITRFRAVGDPKGYQKSLTNVFGRASQICFANDDSRPSLYSARHQFAANLKQSNLSKQSIAAVMGHVSEDIQTHHYGRTVNGHSVLMNEGEILMLNDLMI